MSERQLPAMLYDGHCLFCNATVRFILSFESARYGGKLWFAPLQSKGGKLLASKGGKEGVVDSFLVVDMDGKVYSHWAASLLMMYFMGGPWKLLAYLLAVSVPTSLGDLIYSFGWRYRKSILGSSEDGCLLPSPQERARTIVQGQEFE